MKSTLIGLILITTLITSCSKSKHSNNNSSTSVNISVNIDGNPVTFDTLASAIVDNQAGAYVLNITGYQSTAGSSNSISISILNTTQAIGIGEYTDSTSNAAYTLTFTYTQQPTTANVIYGSGTIPYFTTVTVTSINSTSIQGTFSGTETIISGAGSPATHTFTDGKFNLNISQ